MLSALASRWPNVPIVGPESEGDAVVADPLRPEDLLLSAAKDRVRAQERQTGASVLDAHFASLKEGSNVAIFCHDNPDPMPSLLRLLSSAWLNGAASLVASTMVGSSNTTKTEPWSSCLALKRHA